MASSDYYDDILRRADRHGVEIKVSLDRRLAELAGTSLGRITESADAAAALLGDDSPALRRAAILALAHHWRVSPRTSYAAAVLDLARRERDPEVRRDALGGLGVVFRETDDVEVGYLLAQTVKDAGEPREVRRAAYVGLCFLRAAYKEAWAIPTFPDAVDWHFVERFLDSARSPEPVDRIVAITKLFPFPVSEEQIELVRRARRMEDSRKNPG
jgi:hypothetical protein